MINRLCTHPFSVHLPAQMELRVPFIPAESGCSGWSAGLYLKAGPFSYIETCRICLRGSLPLR